MNQFCIEKNFWSRVRISDGCWLWAGAVRGRVGNQYGFIYILGRPVRLAMGTHRFSWILANKQDIPHGMEICHSCDERLCVNPDHLFLGTQEDNMKDMAAKGRASRTPKCFLRGESSSQAKLTDTDILAIRTDLRPQKEIASDYAITQSSVSLIKNRKTWSHI